MSCSGTSLTFLLVMLFQNSLHTVFPSVTCCQSTFSRVKGTASIEVQAAAASLFLHFDDAHTWYKCPRTPLVIHAH